MATDVASRRSRQVLVLGRDIRAFLSVIRSLGRASLDVHVGMCPSDDLALKSRYIKHVHDIPDYDSAPEAWLDTVIELSRRHQFDLIIPTHDESAIPVQIHQDRLRKYARVYSLAPEVFDVAFDKIKSSLLVESLGIRIARQISVTLSSLESGLPDGFDFPIVIKPSSSYVSEDLANRREVVVASNAAQLNDILPKLKGWDVALLQDHFSGVGAGVEVLVENGRILYAFQHVRVHEPRGGGASSYRKSVFPIDPTLYAATEKLMANIGYTGVAMVEYKINPVSGDWIFIEINGRFWGSLPLAIASGADFPRMLYELLVDGTVNLPPPPRGEVYCRNIKRDLYWAIDNLKDRLSERPSKYSIPLPQVLREYWRLITCREHVDSFARDDPSPAIREFGSVIAMMIAKAISVTHRRVRSLAPIHALRRDRIRHRARAARNILFLCSGNICRSPFAAAYAREILGPEVEIASSGFHNVVGRQAPTQAVQSARELGVDLASHESNRIDAATLDTFDVVFVFEEKHMHALRAEFPQVKGDVFYLGDVLIGSDFEIADPYGGGSDRFRAAYLAIAYALDFMDSRHV